MSIIENQLSVSRIGQLISALCVILACIGGALFIIEALMSVISVIGRTFFSMPIPGDYELIQLFSVIGITLCLPYCQLKKGHVFVDFFTIWAPDRLKRYLDGVACFLLAICAFFLAWRSWDGLLDMYEYQETSMVISLPVWWGYAPITPAFIVLGITAVYTMFAGWEEKLTKVDEDEVLV